LTVISVVVLSIIAFSAGISPVFFVALGFFAATYPVVYAIYSVSASLNIHLDLVTRLLVHVVATDIETDGVVVNKIRTVV